MFSRVSRHVKEGIHQGRLEEVVRALFSEDEKIISNARKEASVLNPITGRTLEIDVYLPTKKLCFEFQDPHHYISTWNSQMPLYVVQHSDTTKRDEILMRRETIIIVPCWWDGTEQSLIGTIKFERPDLLLSREYEASIPLNPPRGFFNLQGIPGVGELMLASFPNQGDIFLSPEDYWWVGEKYDGIRCCWNPVQKFLYTRSSVRIELIESVVQHFPRGFTDMELWFGRGMFLEATRTVLQVSDDIDWTMMRFVVFDLAGAHVEPQPFEERYQQMCALIAQDHPFLLLAFRLKCISPPALLHLSSFVIGEGGEGLILRKPKSPYEHGRSSFLYKYKAIQGDREALVIEKQEKDKYLIRLPDGITFGAPAEGGLILKKGDVVTFSYESSARRDIPLGPRIMRLRSDLSWEDVVQMEMQVSQLSVSTAKSFAYAPKPARYWTAEKGANMRSVFEAIAKKGQFDPLVATNWYQFTPANIIDMGGEQVIRNFLGSIYRALASLFPEVHFDASKFVNIPVNYWADSINRRRFLERFAAEKGFDPLVAENWYSVNRNEVAAFEKSGKTVVSDYSENFSDALVHLFPEVEFDEKLFDMAPKFYWAKRENRKQFFLGVAKERGFEPANADNWYTLTKQVVCDQVTVKGGYSVMHYYRSLADALIDLFPELNLDPSKFIFPERKNKKDKDTQREIAEALAREEGLDPFSAKTWYNPPASLFSGLKIICDTFYGGDFASAAIAIFPELHLEYSRIPTLDQYHHHKSRTKFFAKFASDRNFDPLIAKNWYKISSEDIKNYKDGFQVMKYYDYSLSRALLNVFPNISINPFEFPNTAHLRNRRMFLEDFASKNEFDALKASNWRTINAREVLAQNGGFLRDYYHGNLMKAVRHLFHDLDENEETRDHTI